MSQLDDEIWSGSRRDELPELSRAPEVRQVIEITNDVTQVFY